MNISGTETSDTKIGDIRLAVMRVVQEIENSFNRFARTVEIYGHGQFKNEGIKRVSNALNNCRSANLLRSDAAGSFGLTDAGKEYLLQHVPDQIQMISVDERTPRGHPGKGSYKPRLSKAEKGNGGGHLDLTINDLERELAIVEVKAVKLKTIIQQLRELEDI